MSYIEQNHLKDDVRLISIKVENKENSTQAAPLTQQLNEKTSNEKTMQTNVQTTNKSSSPPIKEKNEVNTIPPSVLPTSSSKSSLPVITSTTTCMIEPKKDNVASSLENKFKQVDDIKHGNESKFADLKKKE